MKKGFEKSATRINEIFKDHGEPKMPMYVRRVDVPPINDQKKWFLFYYRICIALVLKTIRTRLIRRNRPEGDFPEGLYQ